MMNKRVVDGIDASRRAGWAKFYTVRSERDFWFLMAVEMCLSLTEPFAHLGSGKLGEVLRDCADIAADEIRDRDEVFFDAEAAYRNLLRVAASRV